MKPSRLVLALSAVLLCALASADESGRSTPVLPQQFAGWQTAGPLQNSTDPAVADPVNADLLKEYGFSDFASVAYTRDDGRKLTIKAARFGDASGAYGAFTYYRIPQMLAEQIGDQGASLNQRVLFYRGNFLVDAVFSRLSVMSAADLRELASALPVPTGGSSKPPSLPDYLPTQRQTRNSLKYVLGPIGLEKIVAPLPAQMVDFSAGAEVALGSYTTSGGEATLMLISYPTFQIAAEHQRRIEAAHQPNQQQSGSPAILDIGPFFDRRTGPIVVIAAGPLSQSEAKSLLAAVNYDANVTWNENTFFDQKNNAANLLVNVIILCGIIVGLMLVAGVAFGGIRIMIKQLLPGRIFDRSEAVEFISLNLAEPQPGAINPKVSSSIKAG